MDSLSLCIIKPDVFEARKVGAVLQKIEEAGDGLWFNILAAQLLYLSDEEASEFYAEHKERPFYQELVDFMSSGPVMVMVISGEGVVEKMRDFIGATDPAKAADGTIRKLFGTNVGMNAIHASDSDEAAKREVEFFFGDVAAEEDE